MSCRVYESELPSTKPPPAARNYPTRLPKPQRLPSGMHRLHAMWLQDESKLTLDELTQAYRAVQETEHEAHP